MARRWSFYKNLLPILLLIGIECNDMGLLTLFKAATNKGMSNHVFVAYAYAIATIVLIPAPFISKRSRVVPPLSFIILSKIVLLGIIGSSSQILGYAGISYSSPTLASSIGNLVPAFTFLLAVFFRMEKIDVKSRTSQAKVMGSIISIAGAFVLTFYKGPSISNNSHTKITSLPLLQQPINIPRAVDTNWVLAGILLTADYLLFSIWYILQVDVLKDYPDELSMLFFYNVTSTIISTIVGSILEPNASAWKIRLDISLVSILCSGLLGKFLSNAIYAWVMHIKGPVFVTAFKPLSIVISVAMGVMFLGDTLYIGSIIGATIISIGLYTVLWGKSKEEAEEDVIGSLESLTSENVPFLHSYNTSYSEKKTDTN
ncbi:WAT1-related protein At3g28050-like [Arachis stenosperma]|uniref:WAT1-related protein At3g28050-like n=1 Tax=Arachis stenosperma TaxID=217475 RepID=UPI0025AD5E80|nr:WAT1-related protein At3g28050-like [Arachis stenosperma]